MAFAIPIFFGFSLEKEFLFEFYVKNIEYYVLFLFTYCFFYFFFIIIFLLYNKQVVSIKRPKVDKASRSIFLIFLFILFGEVVIAGGFPIQRVIGLPAPSSTEFGISGVHGFVNALWTSLVCLSVVRSSKPMPIGSKLILALYPILVFNRGLLMFFVVMHVIRSWRELNSFRDLRLILFLLPCSMVFFIWIGTQRDAEFNIDASVDSALSGLSLWLYLYVCSPIANAFNSTEPTIIFQFPEAILASMTPNVLKGFFGFDVGFDAYGGNFVAPFLNAGSLFRVFVLDFGYLGYVIAGLLVAFVSAYNDTLNKNKHALWLAITALLSLGIFNPIIISPYSLLSIYLLARLQKFQKKFQFQG